MIFASLSPFWRPTRIVAFSPRRAKAMSEPGSFHGRVRPQRIHSAMTAATSASVMGVIFNRVMLLDPHPEEPCEARRLEGWQQIRRAPPSFETRPAAAPHDEGCQRTFPGFKIPFG